MRRRTAHAVSSSSCSTPSLTTASPPSAPGIKSGLDAARAALDVTDALLLRLRRQYRLSTSPSGRLAEAQTLLLRATVCREAQLYTHTILHAVNRRFKSDAEKQKKSHPLQEQRHCHPSAPLPISSSTLVGRTTPFWAALTAAKSRDPLIRAIRKELAHCTQRQRHNGRAGTTLSYDSRPRCAAPSPQSILGTTAGLTLPSTSATPQFMDALARWRHVVEAQQRSLRMEEVEDYCSAAQLFLAAAVEEQQLGGGSASRDTRQPDSLWCESPLMLATHGVTQVLRACGLLLSDAPLEKEVPYPASLVEELTLASLAVEAGKTDTVEDKGGDCRKGDEAAGDPSVNQLVLPSVLARGNPHTTRVWMRVVQLATLLERSALRLPWDTNDIAHDKADPTLLAGVSSTTQPLWEFSAAVLLHRPLDMVEVPHNILESAPLSATTPVTPPSLRDLFRDHALPSASNVWATQEVQAKPGTLPLCLLSLRRAIAAAVRAHHYAEALLDVEVGLHLLRGQEATLDPARSNERKAEPTADSANANKGKTNYERLVFWPEAASSAHAAHPGPTSVSTSKVISSALTYLSDSVSLIMMRVLLLFLTSPLASGEAAVQLQRRRCGADSWWKRETKASQTSLPTSSAAGNASDQHEESGDGDSRRCAGGDVVRGVAVSLISALETLDTLTAQLQLLERHVIEPRCLATRSLSASRDAKCARSGVASAIPASEDVQLLPCIPSLEHRLEHVIVGTLRSAEADANLSEAQMSARHGIEKSPQGVTAPASEHGEVALEEHAPSCAAEVNVSKQRCSPTVCKLTSSARYQQLKLAYRSRLSSRVGNTESSATCTGLSAGAPSTIVGDTDDFHGDTAHVAEVRPVVKTEVHQNEEEEEEDGSRFGTQSSALVDLAQLVQELWVIVETLTLPLRTASTCTTPPTAPSVAALSASLAAGKVRFEKSAAASTGESAPISEEWSASESDISHRQARIALSTVEPRMQRCLRVLGARDRTVLSLLRRLQTELFTPTVCRSFALPANQKKN
ncbi:hypothetical protein JKF63_07478 [Porcisia hertigi]|uniref:Uncharacterized protein n=1 Tax=Porcisia hertigi TaxID=2761500 RepID=A0A836IZL2_9TRYP|nr:hypothetical protein JKF63_07478 [Porcisia hertigi]